MLEVLVRPGEIPLGLPDGAPLQEEDQLVPDTVFGGGDDPDLVRAKALMGFLEGKE